MIIQMQENMGKVYKTEFLNICSRNQTLTELKKKTFVDFKTNDEANAWIHQKSTVFLLQTGKFSEGELYKMQKEKRELYVNECILIKCKY